MTVNKKSSAEYNKLRYSSIRIEKDTHRLLRQIANHTSQSQSNILFQLINDAAQELGLATLERCPVCNKNYKHLKEHLLMAHKLQQLS